ncbi:hypothetical protein LX87_05122 [Larkinella arboricola]|uniref:Uncharacterized protein n=1 Tax=Larkinella arboricola TaxID=643671 RepID=A0A327WMV9_LARAB|nr:hypothetical protein LX87_05122 [Larkinella arboricola]
MVDGLSFRPEKPFNHIYGTLIDKGLFTDSKIIRAEGSGKLMKRQRLNLSVSVPHC